MKYIPQQGDIIKMNFEPQTGHEQKGYRPALVVSNNTFNNFTQSGAMVCPITNTNRGIPIQVELDSQTNTKGIIMCDQVKSLDLTKRNAKFIEKIPNDIMVDVIDIIIGFVQSEN